jgi:hypothetical protein
MFLVDEFALGTFFPQFIHIKNLEIFSKKIAKVVEFTLLKKIQRFPLFW